MRIHAFVAWIHRRPELARVCITAAIGTFFALITYEIVHAVNTIEPRATTSWAIAFSIGIIRQHHLHRTLSFPGNRVPYGQSLLRDAAVSLAVFVGSTAGNFVLTERVGLYHRWAWACCLAGAALFEYLLMKFFVFQSSDDKR